MIGFGFTLLSYQVRSLPREAYPLIPVMAPLWTTFVPQSFGSIFRRITYDPVELIWAKQIIVEGNAAFFDYQPLVAVVITWHDFVLPETNGQSVSFLNLMLALN